MNAFLHHATLAAPLFSLVFVGYALMYFYGWPSSVSDALSRFVFSVALPAMMFHLMCGFAQLPPVDTRLLIAFFGGCLLVFILARLLAWKVFALDGTAQSVFAMGGIFANNGMLGLPLAKMLLGDAALPSVALVLIFNALILWSLLTISIEWSKHGSLSLRGFVHTLRATFSNPLIVAILSGTLFGMTGWSLPNIIETPLSMLAQTAAPMSLIALGMGLSEYGVLKGWRISFSICAIKLVLHPCLVWLIAFGLGLPTIETQVVVLMSSMSIGANVYLMSRQFKALEGEIASSLVLSTGLAALTTPLVLALIS